jgi:predicted nucleotidyltransferase component of viral defense system
MNQCLVYDMVKLIEILSKIIEQIEKNNPYGLIFKGGTALALIHLDHHRDSEDLDFDVDEKYLKDYAKIQNYFINIFENLKEQNTIRGYKIGKTGLATTNRFHMKIQFILHRPFQTKLDIDFISPPAKLKHRGELLYYGMERMFISKIITFTARQEFKDFIDIAFLLPKINFNVFENKTSLAELLRRMIETIDEKTLIERYNIISKNLNLKIKGLRKAEINKLISRTFRDIRSSINILQR